MRARICPSGRGGIRLEQETLQLLVAMHRIVRYLRRTTTTTLHPTQFIALLLIAEEQPIRIGAIATHVPCSQPTATTTVAALETAGLVRRDQDTQDGRATVVILTPQGEETVQAAGRHATEDFARLLARLDDDDRALVLKAGGVLTSLAGDL